MQIIHSSDIKLLIYESLLETKNELLIISAFVKLDTLIWIDKHLIHLKRKRLLVRFRKSDLLFGATDFEIIKYCLENNWEIKFDMRLHSKIFIFDNNKFILGSANLTNSGLSLIKNSNIESVVSGILNVEDYKKIVSMYINGSVFSTELIEVMDKELQDLPKSLEVNSIGWTNEVLLKLTEPKEIFLFKEDLITSKSPGNLTEHDIHLLGLDIKEAYLTDILKSKFMDLKVYNWLKYKLAESNNILYFGKLTEMLHKNIAINELIYRKDVKYYLENLINWIIELEISEIVVDRPNHSQRIRKNI